MILFLIWLIPALACYSKVEDFIPAEVMERYREREASRRSVATEWRPT